MRSARLLIPALFGASPLAHARDATPPVLARFELSRDAADPTCPSDRAVESAVGRHLGYDPFDDSAALLLSARIMAQGPGLQGVVALIDEAGRLLGRREVSITTRDCVELASALVLAISIVLDPPARPPPPEPAPPPQPLRLAGRLGGHAALGAAPAASLGVGAGIEGRRRDRSLGFEVRLDPPRSSDVAGGRVRATVAIAAFSACSYWRMLGACGIAGAGAIRASGEEYDNATTATRPVAHVGPRLMFIRHLAGPLSVLAHVDGLVALLQTNLRVGGRLAWSTPVFSGVLGVALHGRLW